MAFDGLQPRLEVQATWKEAMMNGRCRLGCVVIAWVVVLGSTQVARAQVEWDVFQLRIYYQNTFHLSGKAFHLHDGKVYIPDQDFLP